MSKRSVAAIFAHPDDEVLGCGASLAAHAEAGDAVHILIMATGLTARGPAEAAAFDALQAAARAAAATLGAASIEFADFPDNAMDSVPLLQLTQRVERFLQTHQSRIIYTHHDGDLNLDHGLTTRAVLTAARPLPGAAPLVILAGEVPSSTEWAAGDLAPFVPLEFVDVSQTLERKLAAMACYRDELRDFPHPRSLKAIEALATWRGAQAGCAAAEAFMPLRRLRAGVATI